MRFCLVCSIELRVSVWPSLQRVIGAFLISYTLLQCQAASCYAGHCSCVGISNGTLLHADIECHLVHLLQAAILTGRRGKNAMTLSEIDDSVDRIVAGMEGTPMVDSKSKALVAYHEVGHAICGTLTPGEMNASHLHLCNLMPVACDSSWLFKISGSHWQ